MDNDLHGIELSVDLIGQVGVAWSTIKMLDCLFVLQCSWLACNSGWERLHLRNQRESHESAFHSPKPSTPVSWSEDSNAVDQSTSYIPIDKTLAVQYWPCMSAPLQHLHNFTH